jgi:hypothetical protein
MPMTDAVVRDAVERLRGRGVDLEPGLADEEVAAIESAHGFRFPPDLRRLLQAVLPVSAGFPDWRPADPDRLRHFALDLPGRGVLFDVENNGLWPAAWGTRPGDTAAARSEAEQRLRAAPRLVPVYRHHYLPAGLDGPVLSARQGDICPVAPDLDTYLSRSDPDDPPTTNRADGPVAVPFWGDLVGAARVAMPDFAVPHDGDPAVLFAPLRELAAAHGVETQTGPGGNFPGRGWHGIWFSRPADNDNGRPRQLFGFFATAGGLLLNGCPGLSLVPEPGRVTSLCETLLRRWPAEYGKGWGFPRLRLDADVREEFGLVAVANETCSLDVAWARGREREQTGWRELTDRRMDEIWDRYYAVLTPPTGVLPPSATWDIAGIYLRPPAEFAALEADLTAKVFRILRACTQPGERLYALDLNHPCYLFDPHHPGARADHESWPVPVLPNGDHYNFLAPDLRFGVIGNCVEQTICVFGQPLLDLLAGDPPQVFDRPTCTTEEQASLRTGWERLGWRQLTCDERDEYRDGFIERFEFRPARPPSEGPCFREPTPSITWDIGGLLTAGPSGELRARFTLKSLAAFQRVILPGGQMLALDATRWYEHYWFDPHRLRGVGRDEWALPLIPDGCFSVFVAPDFSFGLVGNPVERTLCVFGRPLLDAVLADPPPGLGAVLRYDGQAVAPTHVVPWTDESR